MLVDQAVYFVSRVIRVEDDSHFLMLSVVAPAVLIASNGAYYVPVQLHESALSGKATMRLMSLSDESNVTGLWTIQSDSRMFLVPKF